MAPDIFLRDFLRNNLKYMTNTIGPTPLNETIQCEQLMLTIAGVETAWTHRRQLGGPARGFYQCEHGGVVSRVMQNFKSANLFHPICSALAVPFDINTVFEAIAWNDALATALARLGLWLDKAPLPSVGDEAGAYTYYLRNWAPGKPDRERFHECYIEAQAVVVPGLRSGTSPAPALPSPAIPAASA